MNCQTLTLKCQKNSSIFFNKFAKVFCLLSVLHLLPVIVYSQDPGIRDSVRIESDSLIVGQSRPIRLYICNDEPISNFIMPFRIFSIDSGFAIYDSIIFVGRMADPSVMEARIPYLREIDGVSPDSLQIGALRIAANDLPPGNSIIAEVYFTGLRRGVMSIDTAAFLLWGGNHPGNHLIFTARQSDGTYGLLSPEFSTENIKVVQGSSLPTITVSSNAQNGAAGQLISFQTQASSPAEIPVNCSLTSFAQYDNDAITPITVPSFDYNPTEEVYEFAWNSTVADVGIWKVVLTACDSIGQCAIGEIVIQIVANSEFILEMSQLESPGFNFPSSVNYGNFDSDPYPEIVSTGWTHNVTAPFALYDNDGGGEFAEVFSDWVPNHPRKGLQIGYIDGDANLDIVQFMTSNDEKIRICLGDGQNGFSSIISTPLPVNAWGLVGTLGNYNNDQHLDYAMGGRNNLKIYKGTSNYMFQLEFDVNVEDSIMSLVSKDFNNDGHDDFIVGHRGGIKVYLGSASAPPTYLTSYEQTFGSLNIDVTNEGSDFNGDNYFDLCVATPSIGDSSSELMVYFGNGDGIFEQRIARTVLGQIVANTTGDFNNDGKIDIGFINSSHHYLSILFGDGDGNFTNELRYEVSKNDPAKLLSTDVDLDGDVDLIVNTSRFDAGSSLILYRNEVNPLGFSAKSVELAGEDNAQLELVSASGKVLNRIANSMPSANYYRRNLNLNDKLDDFANLSLVENGDYVLTVSPDPSQPLETPFTVEFTIDGKLYRLAKDAVMATDHYDFGVCLAPTVSIVPRPGNFIYANPPLFTWPDKSAVDFQLATDLDFNSILIDTTISTAPFQPANALSISDTTAYYWRIKPAGSVDYGPIYVFNLMPANPACGDVDGIAGPINFLDLVYMVDNFFRRGATPPDIVAADLDNDGRLSVLDLNLLVGYLFRSGLPPVCAR